MHITILADPVDNQNAGIYVYTKNLIENLLKIDKKNRYSFIHSKENLFFKNTENYIVPSKKGFGLESYRRFIKIPRLIKKLHPDIVLEPCHVGPFNLPKTIKRAVTIHDLTPIIFPKFHIKRSTIVHKLLLKRIIKNADLILTPSENTKNDIIKKYKTNTPIKSIKEGIPSPKPHIDSPSIPTPYILFLGTIEPRKNLEMLIDVFLELKKEHSIPHKLILAGATGWKSKKILKKAKNKDIILPGYVNEEEKASLYKHADFFVYPSLYEGFGLPPLEAMSHETPVICSTGGSLKELFENHTLTFDPKDKKTLKKHILSLIKNPNIKENLAKEGLTYANSFSWEKTAIETLKAFEKIIDQAPHEEILSHP